MKIVLCILVTLVSAVASDSSHSDSSSTDWEDMVCDGGNYEIEENYDESQYQWHDDDQEQGYEEEWSASFSLSLGSPRISISCFMHGDDGCYNKCCLQCTLYDCTPRTSRCDDYFHCDCDEVYEFGSNQLTQNDFEFLDFNDLWSKTFETSIFSTDVRKRIRNDKKLEAYVLGLLRNPHVSGDDIKSLLEDRYTWSDLFFLKSIKHKVKTKLLGAGKPLQYDDLNSHIDELYGLMEIKPLDNVSKVKHRRRIRKFLQKITNIDDLEELLHLIKLSGDKKLYQLAKSILKNLGYGFEEDGDKPGEKGLLRNIAGELADADEEEIMDLATLNKFMSQTSTIIEGDTKGSSVVDKVYQSAELPTKMANNQQTNLGYIQNSVVAPPVVSSNNVPMSLNGQILPQMPVVGNDENASYIFQVPASETSNLVTTLTNNIPNMPFDGSFLPTNWQMPSFMPSSGTQKNDLGHRMYYIVVDEKGKVSQANMVPKIPFMMPGMIPMSLPSLYPPQVQVGRGGCGGGEGCQSIVNNNNN